MRRLLVVVALVAGCGASSGAPADMGGALGDLSVRSWMCSQTLAAYCSSGGTCPQSADEVLARACPDGGSHVNVVQYTCGDDTVVELGGVDTSTLYAFDAMGRLVAIVRRLNSNESCAGPSTFELAGCGPAKTVCSASP